MRRTTFILGAGFSSVAHFPLVEFFEEIREIANEMTNGSTPSAQNKRLGYMWSLQTPALEVANKLAAEDSQVEAVWRNG